jgi:hypothetical protein
MSQKQLLRTTVALAVIYFGFDFVWYNVLYASDIIIWITIYFMVAYMKLYLKGISSCKKINVILFLCGFAGYIGLIIVTDLLGLKMDYWSNKLHYWAKNNNPFIIILVIALLNLVRSSRYTNIHVNCISKLSLLIYIIHDNIILRTYYRPLAINYIYENIGYSHVLLWMIALAVIIMLGAVVISYIYDAILRKYVYGFSQLIYAVCGKVWNKFENFAIKVR